MNITTYLLLPLNLFLLFSFSTHAQMGREHLAVQFYEKGTVFHDQEDYQNAIEHYSEALFMNPNHENAIFNRGLSHFEMLNYEAAKNDFDRILLKDPSDAEAMEMRGQIYHQLGKYDKAIEDYTKAITIEPKSELYANRALSLHQLDKNEAALRDIKLALKLDPENHAAFSFKGDILLTKGNLKSALNNYDYALKLNPEDQLSAARKAEVMEKLESEESFASTDKINARDTDSERVEEYAFQEKGVNTNGFEQQKTNTLFTTAYQEMKIKNYEDALQRFEEALALEPNAPQLYQFKAHTLYKMERYQEAAENYTKAIEGGYENSVTLSNRGLAYFMLGDYENALIDQKKAILLAPNNFNAYERMNDCYYAIGHLEYGQIRAYSDQYIASPKTASAKDQFLKVVNYAKKQKASIEHPDLNPGDNDLLQKGIFLNRAGRYEEAIVEFNQLLHIENKNKEAYNGRGYAYLKLGDKQQAIGDFTIATELDSTYAEAWYHQGLIAYENKNNKQALVAFDKAIHYQSNLAVGYFMRGQVNNRLQKIEAAMADYNKCLEIEANNVNALNNRGAIKLMVGDTWGAIEDFTQALVIEPERRKIHHNRAKAWAKVLLYEKAIEDYNMALEFDTENDALLYQRSQAWFKLEKYDRAIQDMTWAIMRSKDENPMYYHQRALAFHHQGKHEKALKDYDRSIELKSDYAVAYYNRATVNKLLEDEESACADYKKAESLGMDTKYFASINGVCQ